MSEQPTTHKLSVSTERGEILLDGKSIANDICACSINMSNSRIARVTLTFLANVDVDALCSISTEKLKQAEPQQI